MIGGVYLVKDPRKVARRAAKDRIRREARRSAEFGTAPFLISPVTRPFATPIRRLFPTTVDILVESGALDNAIDAKVKELAMKRNLGSPPPSPEPQIETLEAFIDAAKEEQKTKKEVSVDHLAVPSDIHSAQMLVLSAENQALNDALYVLQNLKE